MHDIIYIKDKNDNRVTWTIGASGIIFYANKFEEVETYKQAIEVLNKQDLTVSKPYYMV